MQCSTSTKSPEQAIKEDGYFICHHLIDQEEIATIRSALHQEVERLSMQDNFKDALLEASAKGAPQSVPLHERFRKLSQLQKVAGVWNNWLAHPAILDQLKTFLGNNILNKFGSAFLKPARIGGPTPWHQDIGLWRDHNVHAMNGWLAIDAATKENGCLQVVKGSHRGEIIEHVVYEDSIHGELPRELCTDLEVEHIELEPGDALFWHSNLWHYSPPNNSDHARLGCGGVWVNPEQISDCRPGMPLHWCLRDDVVQAFPPETINKNSKNISEGY